jgi:hypothetical protein
MGCTQGHTAVTQHAAIARADAAYYVHQRAHTQHKTAKHSLYVQQCSNNIQNAEQNRKYGARRHKIQHHQAAGQCGYCLDWLSNTRAKGAAKTQRPKTAQPHGLGVASTAQLLALLALRRSAAG